MYCGLVYSGCGEGILLGKYSDIIMCIAGNMVGFPTRYRKVLSFVVSGDFHID